MHEVLGVHLNMLISNIAVEFRYISELQYLGHRL